MYKGAISVIFSELVRTDRLKVVAAFDVKDAKTKNITALLNALDVKDALLTRTLNAY
jgi:large subunit ribosomal protein L4